MWAVTLCDWLHTSVTSYTDLWAVTLCDWLHKCEPCYTVWLVTQMCVYLHRCVSCYTVWPVTQKCDWLHSVWLLTQMCELLHCVTSYTEVWLITQWVTTYTDVWAVTLCDQLHRSVSCDTDAAAFFRFSPWTEPVHCEAKRQMLNSKVLYNEGNLTSCMLLLSQCLLSLLSLQAL